MVEPWVIIIYDGPQLRRATRLRNALRTVFGAEIVDAKDFQQSGSISPSSGLIFLGNHPIARTLQPHIPRHWECDGVSWGVRGRKALISVELDTTEPDALLRDLSGALTRIELKVSRATRGLPGDDIGGLSMARWFLEGNDDQEASTEVIGFEHMDLASALSAAAWDLGCIQFLVDGFDEFRDEVDSLQS